MKKTMFFPTSDWRVETVEVQPKKKYLEVAFSRRPRDRGVNLVIHEGNDIRVVFVPVRGVKEISDMLQEFLDG